MNLKYKYHDYDVHFYFGPELERTKELDTLLLPLLRDLNLVNQNSKLHLSYGLFDHSLPLEKHKALISRMALSIFYHNQEPVGFFYNYIFEEKVNNLPIVHQGLLVNYKNLGVDIYTITRISSALIYNQIGQFYTTTLAAAPAVIEVFYEYFQNTWPCPDKDMRFPSSKEIYRKITQVCFKEYAKNFFPFPESLELDPRRQIVRSKALEMGFEVDLRQMPKAASFNINLFCMFWINYNNQEILMPIGEYQQPEHEKTILKVQELNLPFKL